MLGYVNKKKPLINYFYYNFIRSANKNSDIAAPPGYNPSVGQSHNEVAKDSDQSHLITKKSWDIALGPIKQVRN